MASVKEVNDEAVCLLVATERETVMWNGIKMNCKLDGAARVIDMVDLDNVD